jgi:hypothetical protein
MSDVTVSITVTGTPSLASKLQMPLSAPERSELQVMEDELRDLERKERQLEGRLRSLEKGGDPTKQLGGQKRGLNESTEGAESSEKKRRGDADKPAVSSSVVATRATAEAAAEKEKASGPVDEATKTRNKRLFGRALFGTLQAFKKDLSAATPLAAKRKEIEESVEAKVREEKEQQQKALTEEKEKDHVELADIRRLREEKQAAVAARKATDRQRLYGLFKQTKSKPSLYWAPCDPNAKAVKPEPEAPVRTDSEKPLSRMADENKPDNDGKDNDGKDNDVKDSLPEIKQEKAE